MKTAAELAQHVMEDADPTFAARVRPGDMAAFPARRGFALGDSLLRVTWAAVDGRPSVPMTGLWSAEAPSTARKSPQ